MTWSAAHFGARFNLVDPQRWRFSRLPERIDSSDVLLPFKALMCNKCLSAAVPLCLPLAPEQQLLFDIMIWQYLELFHEIYKSPYSGTGFYPCVAEPGSLRAPMIRFSCFKQFGPQISSFEPFDDGRDFYDASRYLIKAAEWKLCLASWIPERSPELEASGGIHVTNKQWMHEPPALYTCPERRSAGAAWHMSSPSRWCNFNVALTEEIRCRAALIEPLLRTSGLHSFKDTQHRLVRHSCVNSTDLVWSRPGLTSAHVS